MLTSEEIGNVIMMVVFVATFLGIFFFTYVAKIENEIVVDQVNYLVSDLTQDLKLLPEETLKIIRQKVNEAQQPDLSKEDEMVAKHNSEILSTATMAITIFLVVGLIVVHIMSRKYNFDMWPMVSRNLIILTFIGIIEYVFLIVFAKNFISADPNYIKLTILDKLT
jgi:hypothetical protein